MPYTQLSRDDRVRLQALLVANHTQSECADQLGVHRSTISRELAKGQADTQTGYSVRVAQATTQARRTKANQQHRKLRPSSLLSFAITLRLAKYWSPEQIAGRWQYKFDRRIISHTTIYQWLWRHPALEELRPYLRHKKLRRKYGTKQREAQRERNKKRWIEKRPEVINQRQRVGDWEGDTVTGQANSGYLATHVERTSGFLLAGLMERQTKREFLETSQQLYSSLPKPLIQSLTLDNGREMNDFEVLEKRTGLTVYFATPYRSWERGSNENANGLLRQFFPKGRDFRTITQAELDRALQLLNTRPRKRLDYQTPVEYLEKQNVAL